MSSKTITVHLLLFVASPNDSASVRKSTLSSGHPMADFKCLFSYPIATEQRSELSLS